MEHTTFFSPPFGEEQKKVSNRKERKNQLIWFMNARRTWKSIDLGWKKSSWLLAAGFVNLVLRVGGFDFSVAQVAQAATTEEKKMYIDEMNQNE